MHSRAGRRYCVRCSALRYVALRCFALRCVRCTARTRIYEYSMDGDVLINRSRTGRIYCIYRLLWRCFQSCSVQLWIAESRPDSRIDCRSTRTRKLVASSLRIKRKGIRVDDVWWLMSVSTLCTALQREGAQYAQRADCTEE